MHKNYKNTLLTNIQYYSFLFIVLVIFSCSKDKFEAKIPSYISIDKFTLSTNLATQGSNSENITDAWVFINDDLIGTYELPARFPVIKEGLFTIKIFAGIKENGVSKLRRRYLLYSPHVEQINLVAGKEIAITPLISYNSDAKFAWLEDFEGASTSFSYHANSDTIINKTNIGVFEGNYSGKAYMLPTMDFFEAHSSVFKNVSSNGTPVYLELNFKTNEFVLAGLLTDDDKIGLVSLVPTGSWKKIYINITSAINSKPPNSNFKVFFGLQSTGLSPFINQNPEIYFDNLKIVHF